MKYLYLLYQLLISPVLLLLTLLTALMTTIGCSVGNASFWSYYPGKLWSIVMIRLLFLPVHVEGREHMDPQQSYVIIPNHQGAFDIFLVYGFLNRHFKWMMKAELRKMPFIGKACESAGFIFVDQKGGPKKMKETHDRARQVLQGGVSLVVFPEGARTFTGHMGVFRRGAFQLADELQMSVVPITINGSFDVLSRQQGFTFLTWHPLRLTIHPAIAPQESGHDDVQHLMQQSYDTIMSALDPKYQGFVENPDQ